MFNKYYFVCLNNLSINLLILFLWFLFFFIKGDGVLRLNKCGICIIFEKQNLDLHMLYTCICVQKISKSSLLHAKWFQDLVSIRFKNIVTQKYLDFSMLSNACCLFLNYWLYSLMYNCIQKCMIALYIILPPPPPKKI